jgi:hypothetical protein
VFVCSEDERPEQATFPDTGVQNRENSYENNNPND